MSAPFPNLFSEITLGPTTIRNRILSTGHQTFLAQGGLPKEDLIAYHETRAKGGVGLIVNEAARFHPSSFSDYPDLKIHSDEAIPHFANLARAVQRHGAKIFGQLSHAGRVATLPRNGMQGVMYSPVAVPAPRTGIVPREMSTAMVQEIIAAIGDGARRYAEAGYDGIELMASHALFFAQFLNPRANTRTDQYGGSPENNARALTEALSLVRRKVGPGLTVGLRISSEELELDGLELPEVIAICRSFSDSGLVDYINTTIGSMAGLGGSVHVVPPMEVAPGYTAPNAGRIRAEVGVPVLVGGRINDPGLGERVIASGQADMVGMTRSLITDPEMPNKARSGCAEDVRACIGCDQSCIGRFQKGHGVSCIQTPRTGREARIPLPVRTNAPLRVMVVGGGPAGMRAAITAAELGHRVSLHEAGPALGGQVMLAQMLPERAEFGGMLTNMALEMQAQDIALHLNQHVTPEDIHAAAPDLVVLATGSVPVDPMLEGEGHVLDAIDVLTGKANPGARVLVSDWRGDWTGNGLAALLAAKGHSVTLAVNAASPGQILPDYARYIWLGKLHEAGIRVIPYTRAWGMEGDTAFLAHSASPQPVELDGTDTIVTSHGRRPNHALEDALAGSGVDVIAIGDCLTARTAEEAIYEGLVHTRDALARIAVRRSATGPDEATTAGQPAPATL